MMHPLLNRRFEQAKYRGQCTQIRVKFWLVERVGFVLGFIKG
jgi:hypothetical protein